jgi:hypothetical protein
LGVPVLIASALLVSITATPPAPTIGAPWLIATAKLRGTTSTALTPKAAVA